MPIQRLNDLETALQHAASGPFCISSNNMPHYYILKALDLFYIDNKTMPSISIDDLNWNKSGDGDKITLSGTTAILGYDNVQITGVFREYQDDDGKYELAVDLSLQPDPEEIFSPIDFLPLRFNAINISITTDTVHDVMYCVFSCNILIGSAPPIPSRISLPTLPNGKWVFETQSEKAFCLTPNNLKELIHCDLLGFLPDDKNIAEFSVKTIAVAFDPEEKNSFSYGAITIEWENWKFFNDLVIRDIELTSRFSPGSDLFFELTGTLTLDGAHFTVGGNFPTQDVWFSLASGYSISLSSIFSALKIPVPSQFPDISIDEFGIRVNAKSRGFYFSIGCGKPIPFSKNIDLEKVSVSISGSSSFYGSFTGILKIGPTELRLTAIYKGKESLLFEGAADNIPVGNLFSYLESFGGKIPDSISSMNLKKLNLSFDALTHELHFSCGATALICGENIDLTVKIDVTKIDVTKKDSSYCCSFDGKLKLAQQEFELILDSHLLKAKWESGGKDLELKDIAKCLGFKDLPDIPEDLDLALKSASLEYNKETKEFSMSAESKYGKAFFISKQNDQKVSGAVFGLGFNDINLSRLPIIGDKIPDSDSIIIKNLKIIISNSSFKDFTIPGDTAKLQLNKGVLLNGTIDFKDSQHEININLSSASDTHSSFKMLPLNAKDSPGSQITWIQVQRTIGPICFKKIGFGYAKSSIWFYLDAVLVNSGLTIELEELSLHIPLKSLSDVCVDLAGLNIDYKSESVEIDGGFLKVPNTPPDLLEYNGNAIIKTAGFSISAIGSYAKYKKEPSLFIFAVLNYPIGGPAFFFVTGLAAGFGYNRGFNIPELNQLKNFPLVQSAMRTGKITPKSSTSDALKEMSSYIPPSIGSGWIAAGVLFTSFEMIKSFALLSVVFGTRFEILLLGLSTLSLPAGDPVPVAYAEMALEVRFEPDSGLIAASALLTPASYVFSKNCHITGGFAFYIWYSGPHKGDFIVTLGGYHTSFEKPAHYPAEPRLGLNWKLSENLEVKGGCYFAITPSCVMAGGSLDITYHLGNLQAWFRANANFLIEWNPFHYDITIGTSVGASYRVHCWFIDKTFSIELCTSLHLWGPDFSGTAHIKWYIISFTISFGAKSNQDVPKLSWDEFRKAFLPKITKQVSEPLTANTPAESESVCSIQIANGLISEIKNQDGTKQLIMNAEQFSIVTHSVIPSTSVKYNDKSLPATDYYTDLSIKPMGTDLTASHCVLLQYQNEKGGWENVPDDYLDISIVAENVPEALWGKSAGSAPRAKTIINVPMGLKLATKKITYYYGVPRNGYIDLSVLKYEPVDAIYLLGNLDIPANIFDQKHTVNRLKSSIMTPGVIDARKSILETLLNEGLDIDANVDLTILAADANTILTAPPILSLLGTKEI